MKKIALVAASLTVLTAGTASAADLAARPYTKAPQAAVMTWGGFYVGAQGGGGWGNSDEVFLANPNAAGFAATQSYDLSGGFAGGVGTFTATDTDG